MTISIPARRRWPAAVAAAVGGIAVGLLIGLAVSGGDDADPIDAVRDASATANQAATVLEVVPIEYAEALRGQSGSRAEGLEGARGAVARSRSRYLEIRPVVAQVDPAAAKAIDAAYDRLRSAIDAGRPANQVEREVRRLRDLLRESLGRPAS